MRDKNGRYSIKEKEKDIISTSSFNRDEAITSKKGWIAKGLIDFYHLLIRLALRMIIDVFVIFLLMTILNKLRIFKFFSKTYHTISDTLGYIKENATKIKDEIKNGGFKDKFVDD